ncbi:hypothetical protein DFH28DRAFT_579689 [Melampsora americana]|nr:hypothetical protein DFH28DRAFT_579689 [Melampsora americana]
MTNMNVLYWYILILLTFQSTFCAWWEIKQKMCGLVSMSEHDSTWRPSKKWKDFMKEVDPPTKLTKSQRKDIMKFWRKDNHALPKDLHDLLVRETYLISIINGLIISQTDSWVYQMTPILWKITSLFYSSIRSDRTAAYKILHYFLTLEEIPFDVWPSLHKWFLNMYRATTVGGAGHLNEYSNDFEGAFKLAERKSIEIIKSLDDGEPLRNFFNTQRNLGELGIILAGDWTSRNQRELFEFWISNRLELYHKVKDCPPLQLVLETQILQTRLINLRYICKHGDDEGVGDLVKSWLRSDLIEKSKTVVHYINSLDGNVKTFQFLETQKYIHPYGLKIERRRITDQMKVIKFWSTHVNIFLLINKLEETKSLQTVIEDFVVKDFDEVSKIMGEFLKTIPTCTPKNTALAQFLEFYSQNTQDTVKREVVQEALNNFDKNNVNELHDNPIVNNEVSMEAKDLFVVKEADDTALSQPQRPSRLKMICKCFE